jgi:pyrroloquinoline quinone (PQQ) biosynthesis protein C
MFGSSAASNGTTHDTNESPQAGTWTALGGATVAARIERPGKHPLPATPHPGWLTGMLARLGAVWEDACWPRLFASTARGELPPLSTWRRATGELFPIVESFPKYMGISLSKTTYGARPGDVRVRRWLLQNLAVEARHAELYIDWMEGIGVDVAGAIHAPQSPEVAALHDHLVRCVCEGSMAEGIVATNWAIEGVTGVWTRGVSGRFGAYGAAGARLDERSLMWLKAHAYYDDAHGAEALEAVKLYVDETDAVEIACVEASAARSLVLLREAIEASYERALREA